MGCCNVSTNKSEEKQETDVIKYCSDNECTSDNKTIYGKTMKSFKNRDIIVGHVINKLNNNDIINIDNRIKVNKISSNDNNIYYKIKQNMDENECEYEYEYNSEISRNNVNIDIKQNSELKTSYVDSYDSPTETLSHGLVTQTNYNNKNLNIPYSMYNNNAILLTPTSTTEYNNNPYLMSTRLPPLKSFIPQGTSMFDKKFKTNMTPPPPIEPPPADIVSKYSKLSSTKTLSPNIIYNNNNSYNNIHLINNINGLNNEYYFDRITVPHIIDDTSTNDKSSYLTLPKSEKKQKKNLIRKT